MKPDQGAAIARMGATALGFICVPASPRYVTPQQISQIVQELPQQPSGDPLCDRIGVFVDTDIAAICKTVETGGLSGVQLHGHESPEFCYQLCDALPGGIEIIKALRIHTPNDLEEATEYEDWVDAILLDAYHPNQYGGTGITLDWSVLQQFQPDCPWFLAGGLTPDNILDALAFVQPQGVDLSSGVEDAPGDKNLVAVARLFDRLTLQLRSSIH